MLLRLGAGGDTGISEVEASNTANQYTKHRAGPHNRESAHPDASSERFTNSGLAFEEVENIH